jgi:hypothetical protein
MNVIDIQLTNIKFPDKIQNSILNTMIMQQNIALAGYESQIQVQGAITDV